MKLWFEWVLFPYCFADGDWPDEIDLFVFVKNAMQLHGVCFEPLHFLMKSLGFDKANLIF